MAIMQACGVALPTYAVSAVCGDVPRMHSDVARFRSYGGYVTEDFVVFAHKVQTSVDTVPATHLTTLA